MLLDCELQPRRWSSSSQSTRLIAIVTSHTDHGHATGWMFHMYLPTYAGNLGQKLFTLYLVLFFFCSHFIMQILLECTSGGPLLDVLITWR